MSTSTRIPLERADAIAASWLDELRPFCERIEIAGSVRRRCATVGDIELVAIGNAESLGVHLLRLTANPLFGGRIEWIADGPRLKRFRDLENDAAVIDLYLVTPETWGVQFALRTGPAEFSKALVTQRDHGGRLKDGHRVKDGRVWRDEYAETSIDMTVPAMRAMSTPEERDFLEHAGGWVEPEDRR